MKERNTIGRRALLPALMISLLFTAASCDALERDAENSHAVPESIATKVSSEAAAKQFVAASKPRATGEVPAVIVIDSIRWHERVMDDRGLLYRIAIDHGDRVDTLPVLTKTVPAISGGRLGGISYDLEGFAVNMFLYEVPGRWFASHPLPTDLHVVMTLYAFNDDYTLFAYRALNQGGGLIAKVVRWPGYEIEYEGFPIEGFPSDVEYDEISWADSTFTFEFRIEDESVSPDSVWVFARTVYDTRTRTAVVDTIRMTPPQH